MQIILKDSDHTYDASAKQITLVAPYTALSWGQIISIKNLTLKQVLYDHENPTHPISISGAVITYTYDNTGHQDTDILQVTIDIGGSVATPVITSSVTEEASAYESVTVADSAVGLTAGTYGDATKAEMTLETAADQGTKRRHGPYFIRRAPGRSWGYDCTEQCCRYCQLQGYPDRRNLRSVESYVRVCQN
jgi:hypothetical protein